MNRLKNRTKIVATIGPATASKEQLKELITNGVNVCRINFSHGSHKDHLQVIKRIREIDQELNTHTAILGDLQGPKIRIGEVENNHIDLPDGHEFIITTEPMVGTQEKVYLTYKEFPRDVNVGERVLIDDGKLMLEVLETDLIKNVKVKVLHGGPLSSKKGVNLPNTKISMPSLTEKDLIDLDFALKHELHWIALSFVRKASDIKELRQIILQSGTDTRIIAKVEKPEAVENLEKIVRAADGVMVARGDLGVEIPMEQVPLVQKRIVKMCQRQAKPVIIATQMMESMITNITPTRAEVNDVANAVLDGADAVMLSGETSVGKFPIDVIRAMYSILTEVEKDDRIYSQEFKPDTKSEERFISDNICFSSVRLAKRCSAQGIVPMTFSGYTAFKISSFRPKAGIFVFTGNKRLLNILSLLWGTKGFYYDKFESTDQTIEDIKSTLKDGGYSETGDLLINITSMPIKSRGMTNMLRLSEV
jgi:pyruvate kinase